MADAPVREVPQSATDENWAEPSYQKAQLYFHCPDTMCNAFVKLPDRDEDHRVKCEGCALEFVICGDGPGKSHRRRFSLLALVCLFALLVGAIMMRLLARLT
jgi:hypothetical protein